MEVFIMENSLRYGLKLLDKEDNFLQEQAKKDKIETWEDLRDYLTDDCGFEELYVYDMDEFDYIMSSETLGASYAIQYTDKEFDLNDDFFYFDDLGYINSEREFEYHKRLLDTYAEFCEENK